MGVPLLWHLKVSHYNEKARWALDYKHVPHRRRPAVPGRHSTLAQKLTGDTSTLPVLVLEGRAIGDSTRIIAALEDRYPESPLYPADPVERNRVLALEDFFDEELGPHVRLLAVNQMLDHPDVLLGAFFQDLGPVRLRAARAAFPAVRRGFVSALGIDDEAVALARAKLRAAGERFQAEVQPSGYLSGDGFTVADLTLAALMTPLVAPEGFPYPQPQREHPAFEALLDEASSSGIVDWTRGIYLRHRGESAEIAA
jgi:glutathione S-transferase